MNERSYDAARALQRAICGMLRANAVTFPTYCSWPWASVTFSGARHAFCVRIQGDRADAAVDLFLADLDCAEFELRGHILADIALVARTSLGGGVEISLEALTVEDV